MSVSIIRSLSLLFLVGCASISTTHTTSPEGEFDRYQTFYCLECSDDYNATALQYDNQQNRELIRNSIKLELEKRGYIYSKEDPDLLADFHVLIEEKTELIHEAYPMSWQLSEFSSFPLDYQYGTLVVHVVDRNTNQLVWQGTASKVLESPKKANKTIVKAVSKIFDNYPYSGN